MATVDEKFLQLAAANVIERGLELLQEQCAAPEALAAATTTPPAASDPATTCARSAPAARSSAAAVLGSVAASVVAAVDAMQSGSQSDIVVEPVEVEPCSPQGSALTSAFTLLRQTSADLAAEAAAMAAAVAQELAQQHEATLTALNLPAS